MILKSLIGLAVLWVGDYLAMTTTSQSTAYSVGLGAMAVVILLKELIE